MAKTSEYDPEHPTAMLDYRAVTSITNEPMSLWPLQSLLSKVCTSIKIPFNDPHGVAAGNRRAISL